jgi:hypothetical protein
LTEFQTTVTQAWNEIIELSGTDWSKYQSDFNSSYSTFTSDFSNKQTSFSDSIKSSWSTLSSDLLTMLGTLLSTINSTLEPWRSSFMSWFSGFASDHLSAFKTWLNSMCGYFQTAWNNILSALGAAVNKAVTAINSLASAANNLSDVTNKTYSSSGYISVGSITVPRLAQGAVIPANREFLAVLGDQKQGTNVEAPLSTIEQAVQNVLSRMGFSGGNGDQTVIMECDGIQFAKLVYKLNNNETGRVGVRMTEA